MGKYNYFDSLRKLSSLAEHAVGIACTNTATKDASATSSLRRESDRLVCELEDTLFSDFLPPLERESIAACAHSLSRLVDRALELAAHTSQLPSAHRNYEEGRLCVRLAAELSRGIEQLQKIRKPNEMPDVQGFRKLLGEGRTAHGAMLAQLHAGVLPRTMAQTIIMTGRLRAELSCAFDDLVEVMLHNI